MLFKFLFVTLLFLIPEKGLRAQGELVTPSPSPSLVLKAPDALVTPSPSPSLALEAPDALLTPSPSQSATPSLIPLPTRPPKKPIPTQEGGKSVAPTPLGKPLGRYGFESPHFRKRCKRCCRQTKRSWKKHIPSLRRCDRCRLNLRLDSRNSPSGKCPEGAFLGYERNPEFCFYERCLQMLVFKGPCMCFEKS